MSVVRWLDYVRRLFEGSKPSAAAPGLFRELFPHPSGDNGYEELVAACDELHAIRGFSRAQQGIATLSQLRKLLADPHTTECLRLLRAGLAKPIRSPRATADFNTPFNELRPMRGLAHLLRMEQTVLCADGRTAEVVESLRCGLRLGGVLQFDTLIQALVGVAVTVIQVRSAGANLESLTAADCAELLEVCRKEAAQPDPTETLIAGEQRFARASVRTIQTVVEKKGPTVLMQRFTPGSEDEALQPLLAAIHREPHRRDALFAEVGDRLELFYQRLLEESRKPSWAREFVVDRFPADGTPSGDSISMSVRKVTASVEALPARTAHLRLLAVHCAIRRYRVVHGRLPQRLAELDVVDLGDLVIDPFSGKPFPYSSSGHGYSLTSAGQRMPGSPRAVNGRLPIDILVERR